MKIKGFLKRHKNRIMCISSAFVFFCGFVFSSPLKVEAAQVQETWREFYVSYAEPSVTDTSGYVNLMVQYDNGSFGILTFLWTLHGYNDSGEESPLIAYVTINSNSFEFGSYGMTDKLNGYIYSLYMYNNNGNLVVLKNSVNGGGYTFNFSSTVVGCKTGGNVMLTKNFTQTQLFSVYYSADGSAVLLRDVVDTLRWIYEVDVDIYNKATDILNSVDGLENQLTSVINYLKSVDDKLPDIQNKLQNIYDKLDEILEEEQKQTSWLEKIWNSIQEFFTPDDDDKETTDRLEESSKEQSNQLNDLNEQNQVEKLDPSSSSASVDSNVDTNSMLNYGIVLQIFTNHGYILKCMLLVVSIGLVAYVLFGKK